MAGETHALTPTGDLINIVGGDSPVPDYNKLTISIGKLIIQLNSKQAIKAYLSAYATKLLAASSLLDLRSIIITAIYPTVFNATSGSFTVYGFGFSQALMGSIFVEDVSGGEDSNGYQFICSYVSPTEMTATYQGHSTTENVGPVLIYHQDSNNVKSNVLNGAFDGTLVTVYN